MLYIILLVITFESLLSSWLGLERLAGPCIVALSVYMDIKYPDRTTILSILLLSLAILGLFNPVILSYFVAPLFAFRLGLKINWKPSSHLYLFVILFLTIPIIDRVVFGLSDFGEKTGYFLFMKEGNVIGYIFFSMWVLIFQSIRDSRIRILFVCIGLLSAFLSGSNVYLLGVILFGIVRYLGTINITILFPLVLYFISPIFINNSFQFRAILWRIQSGKFNVLDALLSGRISNASRVLSSWQKEGSFKVLLGDLTGHTNHYIEMDILLSILKLGIFGSIIFFLLIYVFKNEITKQTSLNAFALFLVVMFSLVGHGFFRPISMFALGLIHRNARSTS